MRQSAVNRDSPIPLYYQIKLHFKQQMEAGRLRPGDRLPTEMELCEQFDISRTPVRQALTDLAREGYLYRRAGLGTFVAQTAPTRLAEQVHVQILLHYDAPWIDALEDAVSHWNGAHPNKEVNLDLQMCALPDFHQELQRRVAVGEAPDIVPMDFVWIFEYAQAGYLAPFETTHSGSFDELLDDLEPPVAAQNVVEGALYGLPFHTDVSGLWYRRDWFEAEGLEPPETWAAWLALIDHFACAKTKDRVSYQYAMAFPVGPKVGEATVNLLLPFLWNAGATLDNKQTMDLACPAVYKALRFLREITLDPERRANLPPNMGEMDWWQVPRLVAEERVPMLLGGTYELPFIRKVSQWKNIEQLKRHLKFVSPPRPSADDPPVGSLGGTSWTVLQQSPIVDISYELLKLTVTPDVLYGFCEENLQISPYRSVNQRLMDTSHPWFMMIIPLLTTARLRPLVRNYPQVSRFLQEMFLQVLWKGAPLEETVERTARSLALL